MEEDEEFELKARKSHRSSDNKTKNALNIEMEQTDKLEVVRRLEREKKALQKKLREEEKIKPRPMPIKQKRSSKNNLTKSYLSGRLDEDDDMDFI